MKKQLLSFFLILIFATGCSSRNSEKGYDKITINQNTWDVEMVSTNDTQKRGLSHRPSLKEKSGMLFVFSTSSNHSFWMKNMNFPLDIIWINNKKIVKIDYNLAPEGELPTKNYNSDQPVDLVLEINAGEAKKYNLSIGDQITSK